MIDKKVSVILPTKDRREELCRAVASVLFQRYQPYEVIIINTSKTNRIFYDDLNNILGNSLYKNMHDRCPAIRLIDSPGANGGDARNIGVSMAAGELIAFLDDDDYWYPTKLEKQVNAFNNVENGSFLVSFTRAHRYLGWAITDIYPRYLPNHTELLSDYIFKLGAGIQTSGIMVSRNLALRVKFPSSIKHQDYGFVRRLEKGGAVFRLVCEEPLYEWNCDPERGRMSNTVDNIESLNFIWRERLSPPQTIGFLEKQKLIEKVNYGGGINERVALIIVGVFLTIKSAELFLFLWRYYSIIRAKVTAKKFITKLSNVLINQPPFDSVLGFGAGQIYEYYFCKEIRRLNLIEVKMDLYSGSERRYFASAKTWSLLPAELKRSYKLIIIMSIGNVAKLTGRLHDMMRDGKLKAEFIAYYHPLKGCQFVSEEEFSMLMSK